MMNSFHNTIAAPNRTISDFNALLEKGVKANRTYDADAHIWSNSVVKHSDGLYYSFIERWPKTDGFDGWIYYAAIYVSEGSESPLGPFAGYEEVSALKGQGWSEGAVLNPHIHFYDNTYYLFYVGTFYTSITYPVVSSEARANQRIGVATARHPKGPWTPYASNPIVVPRPDNWDRVLTVNPYVWRDINGLWRMSYKSDLDGTLGAFRHGMVTSTDLVTWGGKEDFPNSGAELLRELKFEDVAVWQEGDKWYMLATDIMGNIVATHQGVFFFSNDGIDFYLAEEQPAWTTIIEWSDGTSENLLREEKPFVMRENGYGVVFASVFSNGNDYSFNIARPIKFNP